MTALNDGFSENHDSPESQGIREDSTAAERLPSLSAMFDGEATEQDLECLLHADRAEISQQLESFHLIQQALHKDSRVEVGLGDSLVSRIRADLDVDASFGDTPADATGRNVLPFVYPIAEEQPVRSVWRVALSSVAVAASVTFVVIFAGNAYLTPDSAPQNVVAEVRAPVINGVVTPLEALDKGGLQIDNLRLQNYLRQHAEQASMTVGQGMIPMARVVSYPIKE